MYKTLFLVILSIGLIITNGFGQDTCSAEKSKAVTAYLQVNSIDDLLDQIVSEILKQIPEEKRTFFARVWKDVFDKNEMRAVMTKVICNTFTLEEIEALTSFYKSPEGKSVMKKMPKYTADLMPYLSDLNGRAIQKAVELMEQEGRPKRIPTDPDK